jgi:hypothetical protein
MAMETQIRVVCDRCNMPSEDFDGAIFARAMIFAELRKLGWVRRTGGRLTTPGDECPDCSGKAAL